jgi:hypothetical protein
MFVIVTEEGMNNSNNTIGIIVVGLIAFLAIVVTGKWLLDRHHDHYHEPRAEMAAPPATPATPQQPGVIVVPGAPGPYPYYVPAWHNNQHFWAGYNDGWNAIGRRLATPEYLKGYEIGEHDRRLGRHYYYDHYYPPGFSLRLPGFHLNIR